MTLRNAFEDMATEATLGQVAVSVDTVEALLGRLPAAGAASEATLAAQSAKLPAALDATGRLIARAAPPLDVVSANQALNGSGQAATAAVVDGMKSARFWWLSAPAFNVTLTFEVSDDGGATWWPQLGQALSALSLPATTRATASNAETWEIGVPPGATHIRARVSTYNSGTINVVIGQSAFGPVPFAQPNIGNTLSANATLQTATANIGFVRAAGAWHDDTSTPLAGAGTFTGTARDLHGNASTALWTGSTGTQVGAVEMRGLAVSDVAGTLALEVSRDSSTWRRISEVVASTSGTGGLYVASISYKSATRYARWVYVNGAGAQAHFMLQTFLLSA